MQYISSFFKYLEFEKRSSQYTIVTYECDLRQFQVFLKEQNINLWENVTSKVIRNWMVGLLDSGISPRTISRKIAALKTFFRFLMREGILEVNPAESVITPKVPKKLPVFLREEEMDLLLDKVSFGDDYSGVRDRFIIILFYNTGMRLSEMVGLRLVNIDQGSGLIKVLGKRNKERIIPYNRELEQAIQEYVQKRQQAFPDLLEDTLLLTDKGRPVYAKLIYRVVNRYIKQVSTISKKSPHVLRHTFATVLLNRGADLNAIKELLGHASLAATEVYTHNSFEQLNTVYKQAHPRA
ncbi:integrase [Marinilabiliaceae bacterium JC017]|nr:integrase [Marinilabiliaceae bacterium JC017]